jgi:hypothetical protein
MSLVSSTIIEAIKALCEDGQASMGFFYFDFRNVSKQGLHDLLHSLLTQLLLAQPPDARFYPNFIRITTTERCSLAILF